jgi:Rrf2 family protein
MKFSTKTRYAIRAMIEIALNSNKDGILQKDIAVRQNISNKYLDIIIHSLKVYGLIHNVKGKKSGYILSREPSEISTYDIHRAFEPGINIIECLQPGFKCERHTICATKIFWLRLNSHIEKFMKENTLSELVKIHKKLNKKIKAY